MSIKEDEKNRKLKMFKAPKSRRSCPIGGLNHESVPNVKRRRTSEDFLSFCTMILDYENYDETRREEQDGRRHSSSPLGSTGSSSNESVQFKDDLDGTKSSDDAEDENQVTCYCNKPFARRPMIECSSCLTWIHLSCAKLKRTHIPDTWHCAKCVGNKVNEKSNDNGGSTKKRPSRKRKMASVSLTQSPSVPSHPATPKATSDTT